MMLRHVARQTLEDNPLNKFGQKAEIRVWSIW